MRVFRTKAAAREFMGRVAERLPELFHTDLRHHVALSRGVLVLRAFNGAATLDLPVMNLHDGSSRSDWAAYFSIQEALTSHRLYQAWEAAGTIGPPTACIVTNELGRALLDHLGTDPQLIVDHLWRVGEPPGYGSRRWSTSGARLFERCRNLVGGVDLTLVETGAQTWMAGTYSETFLAVDAFETPGNEAGLRLARRRKGAEARLAQQLPETVALGLRGARLGRFLAHPVLDKFDLRIRAVASRAETSVLTLTGSGPDRIMPLTGDAPAKDWRKRLSEEDALAIRYLVADAAAF